VWELYRSAPFRTSKSQFERHRTANGLPDLLSLPMERRHGATLVLALLESRYVIWFVPALPDAAINMAQIEESPQQIEWMGETLRELCSDRNSSEHTVRAVGEKLYSALFVPFESEISPGAPLQLDVDTSLQRVPFAAFARADHSYLGVDRPIVILPAWWSLHPASDLPLPEHPRVLLVEGAHSLPTTRDGSTATLQQEYLETADLEKMFPQAVLLAPEHATFGQLTTLLASSEIFHFSGHTIEQDHETVLWLSSPATVFAPSALNGISLRGCHLAVLATCSSGEDPGGQSDETGSLTHAMLAAGAANVVASLWDVDSRSSRDLMIAFYRKIDSGNNPAVALLAAQQALHANPVSRHPFFWAPMEVFVQ
jgi:CHAT domain-containing protein